MNVTGHEWTDRETARLNGFVCCIVGEQQYAVRGRDVRNVARAERLRPAHGRDGLAGTIHHAGGDVPVYSLASMVGLHEDRRAADRHVLVTRGAGRDFGLLVDRVVRTPADDRARVLPLPAVVGDGALRRFEGLLQHRDWSYLVLSPSSLDPDARSRRPLTKRPRSRRLAAGGADIVAVFGSPSLPPCPADRYAIEARHVEALAQSLQTLPVPGAAPHVAAIASWRDEVAPVLSFADRAGDTSAARQRFIVVRCSLAAEDTCVAFAVAGDVALHRATRADTTVPFDPSRSPYVRGVFAINDERVALLDLARLLAPEIEAPPVAVDEEVPALI